MSIAVIYSNSIELADSGTGTNTSPAMDLAGAELLVVGVVYQDSWDPLTGITYAGQALTAIIPPQTSGSSLAWALYYLKAPPTGANTLVFTGTGDSGAIQLNVVGFTGTAKDTPIGASTSLENAAGGSNTSVTMTLANVAGADSYLLAFMGTFFAASVALTPSAPFTQINTNVDDTGRSQGIIWGAKSPGAGSQTFTASVATTGSLQVGLYSAVELLPDNSAPAEYAISNDEPNMVIGGAVTRVGKAADETGALNGTEYTSTGPDYLLNQVDLPPAIIGQVYSLRAYLSLKSGTVSGTAVLRAQVDNVDVATTPTITLIPGAGFRLVELTFTATTSGPLQFVILQNFAGIDFVIGTCSLSMNPVNQAVAVDPMGMTLALGLVSITYPQSVVVSSAPATFALGAIRVAAPMFVTVAPQDMVLGFGDSVISLTVHQSIIADPIHATYELGSLQLTLPHTDPIPVEVGSVGMTLALGDATVVLTSMAIFSLQLSAAATQVITVHWATQAGTAQEGTDYTATEGTLTFAEGETSATLSVRLAGSSSNGKAFNLLLSSPTNAVFAGNATTLTTPVTIAVPTGGSGGDNPPPPPPPPEEVSWLVADGSKLRDESGTQIMLRSVNWYGMEQAFIPGGTWSVPYKTITDSTGVVQEGIMDQAKRDGFNSFRILVSQDITWAGTNMNTSTGLALAYCNPTMNPDLFVNPDGLPDYELNTAPQPLKDAIDILDLMIAHARELGMRVILDMHVLAPDNDNVAATNGLWYTTALPGDVGSTSNQMRSPRSEQQAIDAWVFYANRYKDEPTVCAFDLINEPHATTWDDDPNTGLPAYYERVGAAIQAVNPRVMLVCEGNTGNIDQTPAGLTTGTSNYTWGTIWAGKLDTARTRPVTLPIANKVIYSPHEYGAYSGTATASHQWFHPQDIAGYPGPAYPDNMFEVWRREWGYLAEENIAPVWIGEFGADLKAGGVDWGTAGSPSVFDPGYDQSFLDLDTAWLAKLHQYCNLHSIGFSWWCYNPGTVGGIVEADWKTRLDFKYEFLNGTFIFPNGPMWDPVTESDLSLSVQTLSFGNVTLGQTPSLNVSVHNPLTTDVAITAATTGAYSVAPASVTALAGTDTALAVTYTPTAAGQSDTGTLTVTYSTGTKTVALSGVGVAQDSGGGGDPGNGGTPPAGGITFPANAFGITAMGDSLTAANRASGQGWLNQLCFIGNQKWIFRKEIAVIGSWDTSPNSGLDVQLPLLLAMDPPPKLCVIAWGTNNVWEGAAGAARLEAIGQTLIAHNIQPIIWTVPPRNDANDQGLISTWNTAVYAWQTSSGFPLIDSFDPLATSDGQGLNPDYQLSDGLHFNLLGDRVIGAYAVTSALFEGLAPADNLALVSDDNDVSNLLTSGLFLKDSNSDGTADGWTKAAWATCTLVAGAGTGVTGNIQRINVAAGGVGQATGALTYSNIPVTAGQTLYFSYRVKWTGADGAWMPAIMLFKNASGTQVNSDPDVYAGYTIPHGGPVIPNEQGVVYWEVVVPAGAVHLDIPLIYLPNGQTANTGAMTVEFSQMCLTTVVPTSHPES